MVHGAKDILQCSLALLKLQRGNQHGALGQLLDDDFSGIHSAGALLDKARQLRRWQDGTETWHQVSEIAISLLDNIALETGLLRCSVVPVADNNLHSAHDHHDHHDHHYRYCHVWVWRQQQWLLRGLQHTPIR